MGRNRRYLLGLVQLGPVLSADSSMFGLSVL